MQSSTHQTQAYSVEGFCESHGIRKTTFYALLKAGTAPRVFKVGRRTLISTEAAADWRAEREAATAGVRLVRAGGSR